MKNNLKGKSPDNYSKDFKLIETMKFYNGINNIGLHLNRLRESADFFNFPYDREKIQIELKKKYPSKINKKFKIRLLLDINGDTEITCMEPKDTFTEFNILISKEHTNSKNIFLLHKTTNRKFYNEKLREVREKKYYDIIFMNEKNEVTEGSITNIYIMKNTILYTPPQNCGLLNGTIRRSLISEKKVIEKKIFIDNIKKADSVFVSNSIIGLQEVNKITYNSP